jgi:hypothetical protein
MFLNLKKCSAGSTGLCSCATAMVKHKASKDCDKTFSWTRGIFTYCKLKKMPC